MSKRKITLLFAALGIAIMTMMIARSMMTPAETKMEEAKVPSSEVLAATRDLPIGSLVKEADLKWIPWPADAQTDRLFPRGKATETSLVGSVVRQSVHENEPIMAGQVVNPNSEGFLAAVLTPGMRAMSIAVTPTTGVAGFVFPGDRIDVILTHGLNRKDDPDLTDRHVSETVLENVRVLALDQTSNDRTNEPKVAQLATLEVTPHQAERLALAAMLGTLSLSLRSLAVSDSLASPPTPDKLPVASAAFSQTWDSDISEAYPALGREDRILQKVQVMRGKESSETVFQRRR